MVQNLPTETKKKFLLKRENSPEPLPKIPSIENQQVKHSDLNALQIAVIKEIDKIRNYYEYNSDVFKYESDISGFLLDLACLRNNLTRVLKTEHLVQLIKRLGIIVNYDV